MSCRAWPEMVVTRAFPAPFPAGAGCAQGCYPREPPSGRLPRKTTFGFHDQVGQHRSTARISAGTGVQGEEGTNVIFFFFFLNFRLIRK